MAIRSTTLALILFAAGTTPSCLFPGNIPNTEVPDTSENREVVDVSERYRKAVELRDTEALLNLASPNYFEDAGTPQGDDDYGYEGLRRLLSVWTQEVKEIRYEVRYRRVTFENDGNRALVDFTYTGSFTLRRPPVQSEPSQVFVSQDQSLINNDPARGATPMNEDPEVWYRRIADNRLEMEKVDGQWKIIAGM